MDDSREARFGHHPQMGRADVSEMGQTPHAVICDVDSLEAARDLIQDLENRDIPANAIELIGVESKQSPGPESSEAVVESGAVSSLTRSMVRGGLIGLVSGAVIGLVMAWFINGLPLPWGLVIGGLFGVGVGGVAGGMSVAKYSSPAWDETYEVEETDQVRVGVHHADVDVIETAEKVMEAGASRRVTRLGTGES